MEYHRTAKCLHVSLGLVHVLRDVERGKAHYGGVVRCGSVWACPVCAAKIQERRRGEIEKAINWAYTVEGWSVGVGLQGLKAVLVTFTTPHYLGQSLRELRAKLAEAFRRLRRGRAWMKFKESVGMAGFIRALEVTHGSNGWHCHTHELWLVDAGTNVEKMREFVVKQWEKACGAVGLLGRGRIEDFRLRSVDVVDNCRAGQYLAKLNADGATAEKRGWGVERELSKGTAKSARGSGRTPFAILAAAGAGDAESEALYLEYVGAMRGARQLYWSKGLKGLVGVVERSDEELAEMQEEEAETVVVLEREEWSMVVSLGGRAELLEMAEREGASGVRRWFESRGRPMRSVAVLESG